MSEKENALHAESGDDIRNLNLQLQSIRELLQKSLLLQAEVARSLSRRERGFHSWDNEFRDIANQIISEASRHTGSDM